MGVLRARDQVVRARTAMINHVRGRSKASGARLSGASGATFATLLHHLWRTGEVYDPMREYPRRWRRSAAIRNRLEEHDPIHAWRPAGRPSFDADPGRLRPWPWDDARAPSPDVDLD